MQLRLYNEILNVSIHLKGQWIAKFSIWNREREVYFVFVVFLYFFFCIINNQFCCWTFWEQKPEGGGRNTMEKVCIKNVAWPPFTRWSNNVTEKIAITKVRSFLFCIWIVVVCLYLINFFLTNSSFNAELTICNKLINCFFFFLFFLFYFFLSKWVHRQSFKCHSDNLFQCMFVAIYVCDIFIVKLNLGWGV